MILWTITLGLLVAAVVLLNVEPAAVAIVMVPVAGLACLAVAGGAALVTAAVGSSSPRFLRLPVTLLQLLAPTLLAASHLDGHQQREEQGVLGQDVCRELSIGPGVVRRILWSPIFGSTTSFSIGADRWLLQVG